jgi:hypothetical protein
LLRLQSIQPPVLTPSLALAVGVPTNEQRHQHEKRGEVTGTT